MNRRTQKIRFRKLINFLSCLPSENLRMTVWVTTLDRKYTCNSVCCAVGWLPKIDPRNWKWTDSGWPLPQFKSYTDVGRIATPYEHAAQYFGISNGEAERLFSPFYYPPRVTPLQVSGCIWGFCKKRGIEV